MIRIRIVKIKILKNKFISSSDNTIKTIKTDYTKVIDSSLKIETGAKLSQVQNNNYLKVDSINNTNNWVVDNNRTNTFFFITIFCLPDR